MHISVALRSPFLQAKGRKCFSCPGKVRSRPVCVCVSMSVSVCVCVYRCQKAELCETHSESEEKNNAGVPERSER